MKTEISLNDKLVSMLTSFRQNISTFLGQIAIFVLFLLKGVGADTYIDECTDWCCTSECLNGTRCFCRRCIFVFCGEAVLCDQGSPYCNGQIDLKPSVWGYVWISLLIVGIPVICCIGLLCKGLCNSIFKNSINIQPQQLEPRHNNNLVDNVINRPPQLIHDNNSLVLNIDLEPSSPNSVTVTTAHPTPNCFWAHNDSQSYRLSENNSSILSNNITDFDSIPRLVVDGDENKRTNQPVLLIKCRSL